uniref:Uncharacterized protein n=1 Tax=Leersia perrieri TaxID=77586 RepID=A0A0D9VUE2_9ORYZ
MSINAPAKSGLPNLPQWRANKLGYFLFLNNINLGALNRLPSPRPIHLSGRTYSDGAAKTFTGNIDVHQNSASTTVNKVNHFCCFFVF